MVGPRGDVNSPSDKLLVSVIIDPTFCCILLSVVFLVLETNMTVLHVNFTGLDECDQCPHALHVTDTNL